MTITQTSTTTDHTTDMIIIGDTKTVQRGTTINAHHSQHYNKSPQWPLQWLHHYSQHYNWSPQRPMWLTIIVETTTDHQRIPQWMTLVTTITITVITTTPIDHHSYRYNWPQWPLWLTITFNTMIDPHIDHNCSPWWPLQLHTTVTTINGHHSDLCDWPSWWKIQLMTSNH